VSELVQRSGLAGHGTRLKPSRHPRAWLAAYSVVLSGLVLSSFASREVPPIMSSRSSDVSASIAVLDHGGPPLLASDVPYHAGIDVSHLRPVGVTDDQGIYVYLPLLSRITGEHDPSTLMKWLFTGCFALLVLVLPLMFFELFGSVAVAVGAPILALWKFGFTEKLDLYWVLSWCMLLGIPGVVLAYRWWTLQKRRRAVVLLVALMIAASFSTSIRIHSGLPILVGALGVVLLASASPWRERGVLVRFWRLPRWWVRPAVAVGLVIAYLSIGTFGLAGVRAYRNHVIHQPNFGSTWPTQHPFWHNAYIGLGYLPNPYGIEWNDLVAADAVQRARPGTGFLTKEYEATLRHQYAEIARHDPGFVLRNVWMKARVLVADAVSRFWPAFLLLPVALLVGFRRRELRVALLVAVPAALFGALAPLLTIPYTPYELGWLGTWGALFLLTLGWLWTTVRAALSAEVPADLAPLRDRPDRVALEALRARLVRAPAAWAAVAGTVVALSLATSARPAPEPSSFGLYISQQSSFVDPSWLDRPALRSWRFAGVLPRGWKTLSPAFLQPDNGETSSLGLYVRSGMVAQQDELSGPPVDLRPGTYDLVGSGRPIVGGFQLALRGNDETVLAATGYSTVQSDFLSKALRLQFKVSERKRVHVVVSSWSAFPNASAWVLWKMKLLRAR